MAGSVQTDCSPFPRTKAKTSNAGLSNGVLAIRALHETPQRKGVGF